MAVTAAVCGSDPSGGLALDLIESLRRGRSGRRNSGQQTELGQFPCIAMERNDETAALAARRIRFDDFMMPDPGKMIDG